MVVKIKKTKRTKMCVKKWKLKFENYENFLEAIQLNTKIEYLEKIKLESLRKNHDAFIRNNKSISKHSKGLNVKSTMFLLKKLIRLHSNDDKGMQSIDSIKIYAYGTSKDLVSEKEEIKCNYIIKQ